MAKADAKLIAVGALKGPHGLQGMVKAKLGLEDVELVMRGGPLVTKDGRELTVVHVQQAGQGLWALKIEGIDTVNAAYTLQATQVFLHRGNWPELAGEVYLDEVLGLQVVDADGNDCGVVERVMELPAGPAMEIGGKLVPLQGEFAAIGDQVVLTELGLAILRLV